ncbi:MAG: tripartite tricarboxylate transporter substrate binding protein [Burkholderiales bacterium]
MKKQILTVIFLAVVFMHSGLSIAQTATDTYPAKTVRIIAPFPPGGSVDTVGRLIAARLTESYGQTFVIDNRGGASGNIGMELAANAPGDGYTLVVNTVPLVTNQFLYKKVPYDVLRDFMPVSLLTGTATALIVHPSLPVKTVRELIALAQSRNGAALNYGGAGAGTNPHIAGELFNYLAKTNITVIHFKGGGPAMIAALSGEIGIGFPALPDTLPHVRSGKMRAIGVTSVKRAPQLPNVPAIGETLPGYEFTTWQGMLAPKNTPRAIVTSLSERIQKSLANPDYIKRFNDSGLDIIASTPDEFAAHLKKEVEKWGKVIKERGMKAE